MPMPDICPFCGSVMVVKDRTPRWLSCYCAGCDFTVTVTIDYHNIPLGTTRNTYKAAQGKVYDALTSHERTELCPV